MYITLFLLQFVQDLEQLKLTIFFSDQVYFDHGFIQFFNLFMTLILINLYFFRKDSRQIHQRIMSNNLLLDTQIFEKNQIINQLKQRIEQLEMEKRIWQDKIFSLEQSEEDIKQIQSIIQQIQMPQMDDYFDSRIVEDQKLQNEINKKEDSFCSQCKDFYYSLNRSIHNSFDLKMKSIEAKPERIIFLETVIEEQIKDKQLAIDEMNMLRNNLKK
ncbi:hypothetical protein pb186bvf_004926 [Paramecium bursaria]